MKRGLRQEVDRLNGICERLFFKPIAVVIGGLATVSDVATTMDYWVTTGYAQWVEGAKIINQDQEAQDYFEEELDNDPYFQAFLTKAATL